MCPTSDRKEDGRFNLGAGLAASRGFPPAPETFTDDKQAMNIEASHSLASETPSGAGDFLSVFDSMLIFFARQFDGRKECFETVTK